MPSDAALNRFFTPPLRRLSLKRQRPLEGEIAHMTVLDWLSLALATGLFVYLLVALLRATVPRGGHMNSHEILLILAFFALVLVPAPFLGRYCFKVMEGQRNLLSAPLAPLERVCYRLFGVDPASEQDWKTYTLALLAFNLAGLVLLFSILMLQGSLPLNPQHLPGLEWTLAFNTAVSFVTNTNWQAYSGEASLSYFSQMVGLTVQNFVSAAVGLCVLVALARGISRRSTRQLGNFWVDLTRGTLYVLLPLCLLLALLLVWQGVPQTFFDYVHATTLQAPSRPSRSARRPARSPSSSWAPMAAASSASTRPIRSRTRAPGATCSKWPRSS